MTVGQPDKTEASWVSCCNSSKLPIPWLAVGTLETRSELMTGLGSMGFAG